MVDPMEFMVKDIPGYEGLYRIYSDARVFSVKSNRFLNPFLTDNGYLRVGLYKDGVTKYMLLHRLYAEAFCPNPLSYQYVMHLDNIKTHISRDNLCWGTLKENFDQAVRDGLIKEIDYDNRKYYVIVKDGVQLARCLGVKEVMETIGYKTYYATKHLPERHSKILYGPYKDAYVERDEGSTINP